jgi:osmotically-inducible protein OsmY
LPTVSEVRRDDICSVVSVTLLNAIFWIDASKLSVSLIWRKTMGWLKKMFGMEKAPENAQVNPAPAPESGDQIAPERVGLSGEYDESGLAKRVALAYDSDSSLEQYSEDTVWVAQTGSTVVLKGKVPSQDVLDKLTEVAMTVNGATEVSTAEVDIS